MGRKRQEITISICRRPDRKHLVYRWSDRVAGVSRTEGTGTASRREAEDGRPALRARILAMRDSHTADVAWSVFRERYEREKLRVDCRPNTMAAWRTAANAFERIIAPVMLADLHASNLSKFRGELHETLAPASIDSYFRSLRAAAIWAGEVFAGYKPPKITTASPPAGGRPLTGEEVERMIAACEKVVGPQRAGSWRFLIKGIKESGLRLGQALALSWEIEADAHVENLEGKRPMIRIAAVEGMKTKEARTIPIMPPLLALLRQVPPSHRQGHVFNPRGTRGILRNRNSVSTILRQIGRAALIKVGEQLTRRKNPATGRMEVVGRVPKWAGAHDLKRTFVARLVERGCHAADLATMAQHKDFSTTQQHYTDRDAASLYDRVAALYD